MFSLLENFWIQILNIFIPDNGEYFGFGLSNDYGTGAVSSSWNFVLNKIFLSRFLSFLCLAGLSVFLFYQVYKLIHALIGGVYENDI